MTTQDWEGDAVHAIMDDLSDRDMFSGVSPEMIDEIRAGLREIIDDYKPSLSDDQLDEMVDSIVSGRDDYQLRMTQVPSDNGPIVVDVRPGYLGWSNVRTGLEFYRGDGKNNRWEPRHNPHYGGEPSNGLLLQDDIETEAKLHEGSVCVVVTFGTRDIAFAQRLAGELLEAFKRDAPESPDQGEA